MKVISEDLIYYLNGIVLAYWTMDDGSWTGSGILIHCNSFSESNVFLLVKLLKDKYGIKVSVQMVLTIIDILYIFMQIPYLKYVKWRYLIYTLILEIK